MIAYLEPNQQSFSQQKCLAWASNLIEDAKRSYSSTGLYYYQQIKQKGGKVTMHNLDKTDSNKDIDYEKYGELKIQIIPLLQENNQSLQEEYDIEKNILTLKSDVFLLKDEEKSIYLFGVHSTMILFGMGLLELCSKSKAIETSKEEDKDIVKILKKAKQLFVYTTAIAEEGGKYKKMIKKTKMKRKKIQ